VKPHLLANHQNSVYRLGTPERHQPFTRTAAVSADKRWPTGTSRWRANVRLGARVAAEKAALHAAFALLRERNALVYLDSGCMFISSQAR
jgi:hypothetical protein